MGCANLHPRIQPLPEIDTEYPDVGLLVAICQISNLLHLHAFRLSSKILIAILSDDWKHKVPKFDIQKIRPSIGRKKKFMICFPIVTIQVYL